MYAQEPEREKLFDRLRRSKALAKDAWLDLLQQDGGGYELKKTRAGQTAIHLAGAPFVTLMPEMFDYALRLAAMDAAGEEPGRCRPVAPALAVQRNGRSEGRILTPRSDYSIPRPSPSMLSAGLGGGSRLVSHFCTIARVLG